MVGGITRRRHKVRLVEDGEPFVYPADGVDVLWFHVAGDEDVVRGRIDEPIGWAAMRYADAEYYFVLRTAYCLIKSTPTQYEV